MKHPPDIFRFRLYVAGNAPNSVRAMANLYAFCREHLPDRHEIEVVDVLREPHRALADGVMLTPMLVKLLPEPQREIVGSLSHTHVILQSLGLNL